MINKNNITDFSILNKKYVDIFGINIKLSKIQISKLKNKYLDSYKGLDLVQLSNIFYIEPIDKIIFKKIIFI